MNRRDPYRLDDRDRLLLAGAELGRVAGEARGRQHTATPEDSRDLWRALGRVAAVLSTLIDIETRRTQL